MPTWLLSSFARRACGAVRGSIARSVILVALGLIACGCQPALKPDYDYPEGWPPLVALESGLSGLAGTYASEGTALTAQGGQASITLADLLPDGRHFDGAFMAAATSAPVGSAVLTVLPSDGWQQPFPRMQAIIMTASGATVHDVEAGSGHNALFYDVQLDARRAAVLGFDAGQAAIQLTRGADGSLIAKIQSQPSDVLTIDAPGTRSSVWARFPQLSP